MNKNLKNGLLVAIIAFFFIGMFFSLPSCEKNEVLGPRDTISSPYTQPKDTALADNTDIIQHGGIVPDYIDTAGFGEDTIKASISAARMINTPTRVGMYISDVHSHLSDTAWLNAKVKYYKKYGFNRMMIYNIDNNTYLTGSNATKLRAFTANLKNNGILMDIVFSKAVTCTTSINTYINGCNSSNKPAGVRWEKEYYRTGGFLPFKPELPVVYNWAKSKGLDVSYYFPWTSTDCSQREQFTDLCKYNDYIQFHDYRVAPQWSYMRTRMDSCGAAYKALIQAGLKPLGSKMKVGMIASAEDPKYGAPSTSVFSGIWFETHSVLDFWNAVLSQHNSNLLTNESYMDIRYIDVFSDKYFKQIKL